MRLVFLPCFSEGRRRKMRAHGKSGPLHLVVILPAKQTADQGAVDPVPVGIPMHGFDEVGIGLPSLPYGERYKAALPADAGKGEATALFVVEPIYVQDKSASGEKRPTGYKRDGPFAGLPPSRRIWSIAPCQSA
jgi:hypothetical protein